MFALSSGLRTRGSCARVLVSGSLLLSVFGAAALLAAGCAESSGNWESTQDFNDSEQEYFPTVSAANTTARAEGGRYIVIAKQLDATQTLGAPLHASIEHLEIEANALKPKGGADWVYAIGCWTKPNGPGYLFAVSETDGYAILKTSGGRTGTATWRSLGTKSAPDIASKNEVKIRGTCEGGGNGRQELRMYVDDALVVEAADPSGFEDFSASGFVVIAREQTTEFSFDDFAARER